MRKASGALYRREGRRACVFVAGGGGGGAAGGAGAEGKGGGARVGVVGGGEGGGGTHGRTRGKQTRVNGYGDFVGSGGGSSVASFPIPLQTAQDSSKLPKFQERSAAAGSCTVPTYLCTVFSYCKQRLHWPTMASDVDSRGNVFISWLHKAGDRSGFARVSSACKYHKLMLMWYASLFTSIM